MEKIAVLVNKIQREGVFGEKYFERLRKSGELKIYDRDDFSDEAYAVEFVKGSSIIITSWGSPKLTQPYLDACPDLKAIIHGAGTIKPILSDEAIALKPRCTSSACAIGEGVAESALAFAISACKKFYWLNEDTHNKMWAENKSGVVDFYDIKVGVISGGFVGRHMVKLLKNFHVDILMYDPILSKEQIAEIGAEKVELNELLSQCDVISVHAPSIPATDNMINRENLPLIKDGAVLINTSRGSVIEEPALIEELKTGRFYACIDVTNPEPPLPENGLRELKNVILTPHLAGTATNGKRRIALHVCEEIERFVSGEKMKAEIDLDKLSQMA